MAKDLLMDQSTKNISNQSSLLIQFSVCQDVVSMRVFVSELSNALCVSEPELLWYRHRPLLFLPFSVQLKTCKTIVFLLSYSLSLFFWTLIKSCIFSFRIVDSCNSMRMSWCNLTLHSFNRVPMLLSLLRLISACQRICPLEFYWVALESKLPLFIWLTQNWRLLSPFLVKLFSSV